MRDDELSAQLSGWQPTESQADISVLHVACNCSEKGAAHILGTYKDGINVIVATAMCFQLKKISLAPYRFYILLNSLNKKKKSNF